jgi:hypothetical protein
LFFWQSEGCAYGFLLLYDYCGDDVANKQQRWDRKGDIITDYYVSSSIDRHHEEAANPSKPLPLLPQHNKPPRC